MKNECSGVPNSVSYFKVQLFFMAVSNVFPKFVEKIGALQPIKCHLTLIRSIISAVIDSVLSSAIILEAEMTLFECRCQLCQLCQLKTPSPCFCKNTTRILNDSRTVSIVISFYHINKWTCDDKSVNIFQHFPRSFRAVSLLLGQFLFAWFRTRIAFW